MLSVLHKEFSLSAKLLKNNVAGILLWDGMNHAIAQLKNITTVENIVEGDTVVVQHSLIFLPITLSELLPILISR